MSLKITSLTLLLTLTVLFAEAQIPPISLNVKPMLVFDEVSDFQSQIGLSVKVYKPIKNRLELFSEVGYANFGTSYNRAEGEFVNGSRNAEQFNSNRPAAFLNLGIDVKWDRFAVGCSPLLIYAIKEESYRGNFSIQESIEHESFKDHFIYGFTGSAQLRVLSNGDSKSLWLEPFFVKTFSRNTVNVLRFNALGCGINYRFN